MTDGKSSIKGHEFYGVDGDDESHSMLVVQCEGVRIGSPKRDYSSVISAP